MKRIVFILFISISLNAFALTKEYFVELGAKCETSKSTICILKHKSYPNKVAYIFNESEPINDILFHLHGHSFGPLATGEDFDSTPIDLVTSFKLNEELVKHPNLLMVVPFTTGKCSQFDSYLRHNDNFEELIEQTKSEVNTEAKVHLSAHSGGGRTIARTVNKMSTIISSVTLFDAIYNSSLSGQYSSWFKLPNKIFNLIAVAPRNIKLDFNIVTGATPFNESKVVFNKVAQSLRTTQVENFVIHEKKFESKSVNFIYEANTGNYHHWYIVRDSFGLALDKILNK